MSAVDSILAHRFPDANSRVVLNVLSCFQAGNALVVDDDTRLVYLA